MPQGLPSLKIIWSLAARRAKTARRPLRKRLPPARGREGRLLGAALAQAVNILNPARVILGGGVSLAYDVFGPALEQALGRNIYRKASGNVDVMPTPLGYDGGLYAAAALAILRAEKG